MGKQAPGAGPPGSALHRTDPTRGEGDSCVTYCVIGSCARLASGIAARPTTAATIPSTQVLYAATRTSVNPNTHGLTNVSPPSRMWLYSLIMAAGS